MGGVEIGEAAATVKYVKAAKRKAWRVKTTEGREGHWDDGAMQA